ncbi:hypothetical protein [Planosporangium mesophilum]|uniref:3-hydroxyacyl-CoA dehydrogenase C-terminal domain-containing protein n=1 Tax=Planosporangium mesophilum TaxID=689768 RepID=A0A8J3X1W7_9ACTN|nr:hypothetical protein [Planosporangium mesophilum]GII24862.1 hypothetical protein Pme01_44590 [Planosporangium mesophilum]
MRAGRRERPQAVRSGQPAWPSGRWLGSILGIGFAPWSGGILQFINSCGLTTFVERADYLADTYGERFRPPALLRELAVRGEQF